MHPNLGVAAAYRGRLERLVDEMHRSLIRWIVARWRGDPPATLASDAAAVEGLQAEIRQLGRRWRARFDRRAPTLAAGFVRDAQRHAEGRLGKVLSEGGLTKVQFRITPAVRDALGASVGENVALIRSVAAAHLVAVEGVVMRSVAAGRDLGDLARELEEQWGVTRRRAALIARDQNNKATAVVVRARQLEAGIGRAVWLHSGGGRHPRPSHVKNNGRTYDVVKGWFDPDERQWIYPGMLINCRCVSRPVVEDFV